MERRAHRQASAHPTWAAEAVTASSHLPHPSYGCCHPQNKDIWSTLESVLNHTAACFSRLWYYQQLTYSLSLRGLPSSQPLTKIALSRTISSNHIPLLPVTSTKHLNIHYSLGSDCGFSNHYHAPTRFTMHPFNPPDSWAISLGFFLLSLLPFSSLRISPPSWPPEQPEVVLPVRREREQ